MPYLLRSKLKLLLEQGDGQDDLAAFIDGAMKFPERKALLEVIISQYEEICDIPYFPAIYPHFSRQISYVQFCLCIIDGYKTN